MFKTDNLLMVTPVFFALILGLVTLGFFSSRNATTYYYETIELQPFIQNYYSTLSNSERKKLFMRN